MSQGWIGVFPKDVWTLIIDCMYPRFSKEFWCWLVQLDKKTHKKDILIQAYHPSFEKIKEDWKTWRENADFNHQVINLDMRDAMRFRHVCKQLNEIIIVRCGFYTIGFVGQMTIQMLINYTQSLREKRLKLQELKTKAGSMRKQYCDCERVIEKKENKLVTLRAIYAENPSQHVYDLMHKYNREILVYENGKNVFNFWEVQNELKLVKKDLKALRPWNKSRNIIHWAKTFHASEDLLWM